MISEEHERLAQMVAGVYRRIAWQKITSLKRSAVDILTDRLRVASKESDIIRAHDKLCASLNIPTSKFDIEMMEALHDDNVNTMEIMREHTGYIAALAQKIAKETKEEQHEN